jgi:hypothetical protein
MRKARLIPQLIEAAITDRAPLSISIKSAIKDLHLKKNRIIHFTIHLGRRSPYTAANILSFRADGESKIIIANDLPKKPPEYKNEIQSSPRALR